MIAVGVPEKKKPKSRLPQAILYLADPQFLNELEDFAVRAVFEAQGRGGRLSPMGVAG